MPLRQAVLVRPQGPNAGYGASDGGVTQPWGTWIKAALDAGADGVIVPQVRTAADVETIVGDCRYPTGPREPSNSLLPDPCQGLEEGGPCRAIATTPGPPSILLWQLHKRKG